VRGLLKIWIHDGAKGVMSTKKEGWDACSANVLPVFQAESTDLSHGIPKRTATFSTQIFEPPDSWGKALCKGGTRSNISTSYFQNNEHPVFTAGKEDCFSRKQRLAFVVC